MTAYEIKLLNKVFEDKNISDETKKYIEKLLEDTKANKEELRDVYNNFYSLYEFENIVEMINIVKK